MCAAANSAVCCDEQDLAQSGTNHHFDKRDAPIGRGKTKKRPVVDHEAFKIFFINM